MQNSILTIMFESANVDFLKVKTPFSRRGFRERRSRTVILVILARFPNLMQGEIDR
jgi:hypothetical protein